MLKKLLSITTLILTITTNAHAAKQFYYFHAIPGLVNATCGAGDPFTCDGSGGESGGEEVDLSTLSISVSSELMLAKDDSSKDIAVSLSITGDDLSNITLSVSEKEDTASIVESVAVSDNDGADRAVTVNKASGGTLGRATLTITATSGEQTKSVDVSVFTAGNCPLAKSIDTVDRQIFCDSDDNYLISNAEDLMYISEKQTHASVGSKILSGDYKVTDNITLSSSYNFTPIGNSTNNFTGVFNGAGHSITGLTIDTSLTDAGLFGRLNSNALVENLAVKGASIKGANNAGGIVGYHDYGRIKNCYSEGTVEGASAGGIAGVSSYNGRIYYSYSTATVKGSANSGGLVGYNDSRYIYDSYAAFTTAPTGRNAGGLIGYNRSTVNNFGNLCEYVQGTTTSCGAGDISLLKASWDYKNVWNLADDTAPKFRGEVSSPADYECDVSNPLASLDKDGEVYLIGGSSGDSARAKKEYICVFNNQNRNSSILSSKYKLTSDIDLTGVKGIRPIGTDISYFGGVFNGDSHSITGLTMDTSLTDAGLFGRLNNNALVENLAVKGVNIKGANHAGGIVGYHDYGRIKNCYSEGTVEGASAGGIAGVSSYNGRIYYSYSTATVKGSANSGGLVGYNDSRYIYDSYAAFTTAPTGRNAGGLIGYNRSTVNNFGNLCEYTNGNTTSCSQVNAIALQNNNPWSNSIWKTVGVTSTPSLINE